MSKITELTALEVKKLKENGFYPLEGVQGLYLNRQKRQIVNSEFDRM